MKRKFALILSLVFMFLLLIPSAIVADPEYMGSVWIEGAHIVSEGAYFRFWVWNHEAYNISVTVDNLATYYLEPNASLNYDAIAPQVNMPFEKIHYAFKVNITGADSTDIPESHFPYTIDFPVYVLDSSFIQFFDFIVPVIIILVAIALVILMLLVIRRRRQAKSD